MAFLSRLQTKVLAWWQDTPLPTEETNATPIFQSWHEFDEASSQWRPLEPAHSSHKPSSEQKTADRDSQSLNLVTWNVDSFSPLPASRIEAILSRILSLSPAVDIIFLQEVSPAAILSMLDDSRLRQGWFLSDPDKAISEGQAFASMTLLSKNRFQHPNRESHSDSLGPVWRVKYPSRFGRDALCCDVFVPSSSTTPGTRIRLVNVHLDSLPIQPSQRPQQVSVVAALLRSAGRGIVAGDFNPVLPGDASLIQDNGLVDAWTELHPSETGFTWGIDGKQPFPPARLDKVVTLGLEPKTLGVHQPESLFPPTSRDQDGGGKENGLGEPVPWSDHSGLACTFSLI